MASRPTGSAAAVAAMVVVILGLFGVDLTQEAAAIIVGGVAAIVSYFTPRDV